jgi:uncharacterized protein (TIGR03118 family)
MQNLTSSSLIRCGSFAALAFSFLSASGIATAQTYTETRLVSDTAAGMGMKIDPNLVNPWGLAAFPNAPFWVSDNGTGLSTLYDGLGNIQTLVVTIPPSASAPPGSKGSPTGIIANTTTDFGGAAFIFDSEDGTISTWAGAPSASIVVDKGTAAVYKGLTFAQLNGANVLYAANFRAGTVEVYDTNFNPVALDPGAFTDPKLPAGFAPFNVQAINGNIFVTFALQNAAKNSQQNGPGLGFVEEFDPSGKSLLRFDHGTYLDAPWGVALAPSNFGAFSNDLLIGNFGSGTMIAFDPTTGAAKGSLRNAKGKAIQTPGLWALSFGLGGNAGPTNWLYFTAGIKGQAHGVFGYFIAN